MSAENPEESTHSSLTAAPVFNGRLEMFDQWAKEARLWRHGINLKKEKQGSRLLRSQTHKMVKEVMLRVDMDVIMKKEGIDAIMAEMLSSRV